MPVSDEEARSLLQDAVRSMEEDYCARGIFQDRFGFGRSPALVVVDFAYGWTDGAYAGGSRRLDGPVEATRCLLDAARARALPVIYLRRQGDLALLSITVIANTNSVAKCPPLFPESH